MGQVQRELARLTQAGILRRFEQGRHVYYQANRGCPVFRELHGLMVKTVRWIRRHETSPREIADLLAIADRDVGQSQIPGLAPEWRFDIAYNAALQLATAALAAAGYRAERSNKHQRTLECLGFTF